MAKLVWHSRRGPRTAPILRGLGHSLGCGPAFQRDATGEGTSAVGFEQTAPLGTAAPFDEEQPGSLGFFSLMEALPQ
jgi:hypothetical protein